MKKFRQIDVNSGYEHRRTFKHRNLIFWISFNVVLVKDKYHLSLKVLEYLMQNLLMNPKKYLIGF